MKDIELELDRQTLRPGDVLSGRVVGSGRPGEQLTVSLQGEEVLSASNIALNYVLPIVDERQEVRPSPEGSPFTFTLPAHAPPTYASQTMRCEYFLKLRRPGGLLGRETIRRFHLSVLPPEPPEDSEPRRLMLEHEPLSVEANLDRTHLLTGQSLSGELLINRSGGEAPLPRLLSFRFAAIEESVEPGYFHREVVWLQTHDVRPDPDLTYPIRGMFDFPIPEEAPFSGEWATFRVHYGFRVGLELADGSNVRESAPIWVYRRYHRL